MDEQDVVLVDGSVDHVRVGLARQQVLVEPLTPVLKRLREGNETVKNGSSLQLVRSS